MTDVTLFSYKRKRLYAVQFFNRLFYLEWHGVCRILVRKVMGLFTKTVR